MGTDVVILKTAHLTKKYRDKTSLEDIFCNISEGKITGIIGAENSGKTTLLQILSGRIKPDSGRIEILEKPVNRDSFLHVSYLSEGDILPGFYTGLHLVKFFNTFFSDFSTEKSYSYAETLKINLSKKISSFTMQNKELLKTILCFSRETSIYLLDNPFMMLDSYHKDLLIKVIYTCTQTENSIIITSRDPNVLELVCDDFLILDNGKSIFYGDCEDFRIHRSQSMTSFYKKALTV
jgi:ABC-2 type transport system ATP-binding protein